MAGPLHSRAVLPEVFRLTDCRFGAGFAEFLISLLLYTHLHNIFLVPRISELLTSNLKSGFSQNFPGALS